MYISIKVHTWEIELLELPTYILVLHTYIAWAHVFSHSLPNVLFGSQIKETTASLLRGSP